MAVETTSGKPVLTSRLALSATAATGVIDPKKGEVKRRKPGRRVHVVDRPQNGAATAAKEPVETAPVETPKPSGGNRTKERLSLRRQPAAEEAAPTTPETGPADPPKATQAAPQKPPAPSPLPDPKSVRAAADQPPVAPAPYVASEGGDEEGPSRTSRRRRSTDRTRRRRSSVQSGDAQPDLVFDRGFVWG